MQYIPIEYNIFDNKKKFFLYNTEQLSRKDGILHIQNINNNIIMMMYFIIIN